MLETKQIRRIEFSKKDLSLEEIVGLIFVNKTSSEFNKELHFVVNFLRKHLDSVRSLGYAKHSNNRISVVLVINEENFTSEELAYIDSISC